MRQYLNPRIIKAGPFALRAAIRIGAFPEPDAAVAREEAVALAKKSDGGFSLASVEDHLRAVCSTDSFAQLLWLSSDSTTTLRAKGSTASTSGASLLTSCRRRLALTITYSSTAFLELVMNLSPLFWLPTPRLSSSPRAVPPCQCHGSTRLEPSSTYVVLKYIPTLC